MKSHISSWEIYLVRRIYFHNSARKSGTKAKPRDAITGFEKVVYKVYKCRHRRNFKKSLLSDAMP